jgi:lipid-A-disaccharide synthase
LRYFFSTGEASGELLATTLAEAIARLDPQAQFEGIGAQRMRAAGFSLWHDHTGLATIGLLATIPNIPKLLAINLWTAVRLSRAKPDLIVLVDFGAFNIRLAKALRRLGYKGAILDIYPPGTWVDNPKQAKAVAELAMPLTAFEHQRDFYVSLGLPVAYFGHPLAARYTMRAPRPAPPDGGGTVALLPGSRKTELHYHVPLLLQAYTLLKRTRPQLRAIAGAADARAERFLRKAFERAGVAEIGIAHGTVDAIAGADAAWVASGTAVLECALSGVPAVAFYVISPLLVAQAERLRGGRSFTLPNLVLQRQILPELFQSGATPERLSAEMDAVLRDPSVQYREFAGLREALGPADAVERCAAFAFELAKNSRP